MPPISPSTLSSPTATVQQLENTYGTALQSSTHQLTNVYFMNLTWLQITSAIISTILIAGTIYLFIKTGYIKARIDRFQDVVLKSNPTKKHIQSSWEDVERHFFAGSDNDLRISIIEADNLLNEALLNLGVQGTQLGERLKKVRSEQLPNIEDVWQAHKLRNQIAHESNFQMKRDLAERALTVYETALKHLGVIDVEESGENTPT